MVDILVEKTKKQNQEKEKLEKIMEDFSVAYRFESPNKIQVKTDYEYYLGKQWADSDQAKSKSNGYGSLTQVNKIRPYVNLLSGYQRQNRNDIVAYPEGNEDSVRAEIATRLIKNTTKLSKLEYKQSQQFDNGNISGSSYLYPYMDYSRNLIHGDMKFKLLTNLKVLNDPNSEEYDNSDAGFQCILREKLTKEQVKKLFPNEEKKIDEIEKGQINLSGGMGGSKIHTKYYFKDDETTTEASELNSYTYDLLEYFYKRPKNKYYVINLENNGIIQSFDKEEIDELVSKMEETDIQYRVVTQRSNQVWRAVVVGNVLLEDKKAEFSEFWDEFPLIPYKAYYFPVDIENKAELQTQGIVRALKDPQKEMNVARTHAIRHIISSQNSGWDIEEGQVKNKSALVKSASKPGVIIERKKGSPPLQRITPMPLSQGFTFLASQNTEDLKQISGINSDLLSMQGGTDSGRAILLRQKQGLVMIQSLMDNFSQTNEILGRFLVATLPLVYTVDRALNILGEAFLEANFSRPVLGIDPATGEQVQQGVEIDREAATREIRSVLEDKELANYNISIGQGANSETVKFNNFLILNELVTNGYPIPPNVLIDETSLSNATKEKIKNSISRTQTQGEQ